MSLSVIFLMCLIALAAGIVCGCLTLIPLLVITCAGVPSSIKLSRQGGRKGYVPLAHCMASFVLLLAVFTLATWGCYHFLLKGFGGYIVGILVTMTVGFYRCGENRAHAAEHWRNSGTYRNPAMLIKASQLFLADSEALSAKKDAALLSAVMRRAGCSSIDE